MKNTDKHLIACTDPFHSVVSMHEIYDSNAYLLGVKNDNHIPLSFVNNLVKTQKYIFHTVDHMSASGRAIDFQLVNPLTGRWMSGSSSGTAVNVFLGMNDIGIGTDGGGSVLGPAMALNLFGFISPLLATEHMRQFTKVSTDGIEFHPSIGFITSEKCKLKEVIKDSFKLPKGTKNMKIAVSLEDKTEYPFPVDYVAFPDIYGDRQVGINFLQSVLDTYDVVISREGPVDLYGYGDTIFGHFGRVTKQIQRESRKGLLRVANMVSATALTVPTTELGSGLLLITKSELENIAGMVSMMNLIPWEEDSLVKNYFRNVQTWTKKGFEE